MKKHYLKKGVGETGLGDKEEGYSIYKNPDENLREKIKNFKGDETKVSMGWPEETWDIIEWEDKEVKCQRGRNVSYFPIKEVKKALLEQAELQRNLKFPAYKHFKNAFGILSKLIKEKNYWNLNVLNIVDNAKIGFEFRPMSVEHYRFSYEGELNFQDDFSLKFQKSCPNMCFYFTSDGDYINRDYNEDLNTFNCEEISMKILLDEFKNKILNLKEVGFFRGNYYIGKRKYQISINREDHELYNEIEFGLYGTEVKAKPKKMEFKSGEDIWNEIEKLIPEDMYKIYNLKNVESNVIA